MTAHNGTWDNNPTSFSYQWQRCNANGSGCTAISGATRVSYTLTAADVDHRVRVIVTARNADGASSAQSGTSEVVSSRNAPANTAPPTISGTVLPGQTLTANPGTWTGGVRSFAYQWQRCTAAGSNCVDVEGATGKTYGVRTIDAGSTLRVQVTATNLAGSQPATSDRTEVIQPVSAPPAPARNRRPTIRILSAGFVGLRLYVRFRVCDDSRKNLNIIERDSKPGVPSYMRRFATLVPPRPCATLRRNWRPAPRFRHGRYVVTMWARDKSGLTSLPARRTLFR
jgi:hypothetical protein